jgi:hypothetical protein
MKNTNIPILPKTTGATATLLTVILLLSLSILNAQPTSIDKVRNDFKVLLQRPLVEPNASFQTFTTDSVLIEKVFFMPKPQRKFQYLFINQL